MNNAIWRFWFRYDGYGDSHINWRFAPSSGDTRYILAMRPNDARLDRLADGAHITIKQVGYPKAVEWHLVELSFFNGVVSVFLDGQEAVVWEDTNPWEGGTVGLEPYPEGDSVFYYDDFAICMLSTPAQSITTQEADQ